MVGIEKAFFSQLFLKLLKCQFEIADPGRLKRGNYKLILARFFIYCNLPCCLHFDAIQGLEEKTTALPFPDDAFYLRALILEREISVTRRMLKIIRYLSLDPDFGEGAFEKLL